MKKLLFLLIFLVSGCAIQNSSSEDPGYIITLNDPSTSPIKITRTEMDMMIEDKWKDKKELKKSTYNEKLLHHALFELTLAAMGPLQCSIGGYKLLHIENENDSGGEIWTVDVCGERQFFFDRDGRLKKVEDLVLLRKTENATTTVRMQEALPNATDPQNPSRDEFEKIIQQGDRESQLKLGERYFDGKGVLKETTKAALLFRLAAEKGSAVAQAHLGFCYDEGIGVEQDENQAVYWYMKAAKQGEPIAESNLAAMYASGRGVPQNYAEALRLVKKAAESGLSVAQRNLGFAFERGSGVPIDFDEAVKWYRKAAAQGYTWGQHDLAYMYANGRGVKEDKAEAFKLDQMAAENGLPEASFSLCTYYKDGLGVQLDYIQAYKWCSIAKGRATPKSVTLEVSEEVLGELASKMTAEQIEAASKQASARSLN